MIEFLLSLSTWAGSLLAMIISTVLGLLVYFTSSKLMLKYHNEELKESTSHLFRMIGMLVSLMLSLAFAEVLVDLRTIENSIEREALAISDIFDDLHRFDAEKTRGIRTTLINYTQALIDDDWPALADDRLGKRAGALSKQLQHSVLVLEQATTSQKQLGARIIADFDTASDYRMIRLDKALAGPPVYLYVVFVGFLLTMGCLGAYRPQVPFVVLASLYTLFIGLVLYLILALSDPFQGGIGVDPTTFERLVEKMSAESTL